ncbi:hypothetical protein SDC9_190477 [bioreactor metagenome]|uniref:Uncharacterized protein n=1 Tax=bioreactor metagenome TaxID=1076179 RepID=A0A645HXJ8_9ZZZZ
MADGAFLELDMVYVLPYRRGLCARERGGHFACRARGAFSLRGDAAVAVHDNGQVCAGRVVYRYMPHLAVVEKCLYIHIVSHSLACGLRQPAFRHTRRGHQSS